MPGILLAHWHAARREKLANEICGLTWLASKHIGCLGFQALPCRPRGYSKTIMRPMAFSIMWERFRKGEYMTWEELQADLNQIVQETP